jgi:hypothetical protein
LAGFATIGVVHGKPIDLKAGDPEFAQALKAGVREARAQILAQAKKPRGKTLNGWEFMDQVGALRD